MVYAWTGPTTPPPGGNSTAPVNVSENGQIKDGGLLVGFSAALDKINPATGMSYSGLLVPHGNVGIGTVSPVAKLDVAGGVRVGGDTTSCSSTNEGTIRYKGPKLQVCVANAWKTIVLKEAIETFNINAYPWDIVFDGNNAWTADWTPGSASKITAGGVVTAYSAGGQGPQGIAFDGANVWVTNSNNSSVVKINTQTGASTTYTGTGIGPVGIAFDGKNMWTANNGAGVNSVTKITSTGTMTTYKGTGVGPNGIAFDGTNMWTANEGDCKSAGSVTKITPSGGMTTYSGTGKCPETIAFDGVNMWTANTLDGSVTKIKPSGSMATYTGIPGRPRDITFDGVNMWTANESDNSITKIAPDGSMTTYKMPGSEPKAIVYDGQGNLWVGNYAGKSVSRVSIGEL